jgi:RimJ/RimL family protein N-acetyltransferase
MIRLEPFTEADCDQLISWIDSPRLLLQWGAWRFNYPLTPAQLFDYLADTRSNPAKRIACKAVALATNLPIGHIELNAIDHENETAAICRVFVAPEARGQGVATAMVRQMVARGFVQENLRRIELQVYAWNAAALACYQRVGFVQEGRLRQLRKVGDEYWDLIWMSMLRHEWQPQTPS